LIAFGTPRGVFLRAKPPAASWGPARALYRKPRIITNKRVVLEQSADGRTAVVVWHDTWGSGALLGRRRDGGSWGPLTQLTARTDPGSGYPGSWVVAVAGDREVVVAYTPRNGSLAIKTWPRPGALSPAEKLAPPPREAYLDYLQLDANGDGEVVAGWIKSFERAIAAFRTSAGEWRTPQRIADETAHTLSLRLGPDGRAHAAWSSEQQVRYAVMTVG
jgi:hypothetical protein